MAQEVNLRPLTAKGQIYSQLVQFLLDFWFKKVALNQVSLSVLRFTPVSSIPPLLQTHSFSITAAV